MSIPISQVVQVLPGVIAAGGTPSRLSGLVISQDTSIAPGAAPKQFFTAADVSAWFGPNAPETTIADNYFPGTVNAGQLPYVLKFAGYALAASKAGSYGAQLGTLTLTGLQALSGTLIFTVNGTLYTTSSISLAGATSFANAATLMQAGLTAVSAPATVTYDTQRNRFLLLSTATGSAVTMTDISGTLAAGVGLSSAAGAYIATVGVDVDAPAVAAARVVGVDTDWGVFTTAYAANITDRLAYAAWNSGQAYQYVYLGWDTDAIDLTANNSATFGAQAFAAPYQGTWPVYGTQALAGALMGYVAGVNFNVPNGRTTAAFRQFNSAPAATATTLAAANALLSNKYTYLGAYANQANAYTVSYAGNLSGSFLWVDTYIDQIYMNRELQRSLWEGMLAYNSIPYNQDGYSALYNNALPTIYQAVSAGIIRSGVTLSASQAQQVNAQAGRIISDVLQTRGWYLLIGDPTNPAQARQQRTTPVAYLWYTDGGSVQQLTIRSIAVI